tara:strand:+ start:97 stop:570 length:474 start_codon:yes stop_codon:yes gene_type:complete
MSKRELRHEGFRSRFLSKLAKEANNRGVICNNVTGSWFISKALYRLRNSHFKGINMAYVISMDSARVEMWIYHGSEEDDVDSAYEVFKHFQSKKSEIELAYGSPLEWNLNEDRTTGFSIEQVYRDFKLSDVSKWDYWVKKMVTDMKSLDDAFIPHYT